MWLPDTQADKDAKHAERLLAMSIADEDLQAELDRIWFKLIDARNTGSKNLLQDAIDDLGCIIANDDD
ncbi:MAG: hypothetical protein AAF346_00070 [Pseudomonadota bacterium]